MSVKAFVVLTLEQAGNSNNVLASPLFLGPNYVPLKENADVALRVAMDKTIVSGMAASKPTEWVQVEIPLSEELQLRAYNDETLVRDKFHRGWKWFGPLDLAKMTGVKVSKITLAKLTMPVWTKRALDGGWLDRRDAGKCTECEAEEIPVWAPKSWSSHWMSSYYCADCWLREMLRQHAHGSTASECKKGAAMDCAIEPSMPGLALQVTGQDGDSAMDEPVA